MMRFGRWDHIAHWFKGPAFVVMPFVLAGIIGLSSGCGKQTLSGSDAPSAQTPSDQTPEPTPTGPDPNTGLNVRKMAADATSYAITYGALDAAAIETLKTYPLVIVHPYNGDLTRSQIFQIKQGANLNTNSDNVVVLCYISVGEDDRTYGLTDAQMLADSRFRGDGSGPSIDPRASGERSLDLQKMGISNKGTPTNGGYASYYLNDNAVRCNDPIKKTGPEPQFSNPLCKCRRSGLV